MLAAFDLDLWPWEQKIDVSSQVCAPPGIQFNLILHQLTARWRRLLLTMWQRTCHINALTFSATVTSITSLAIVLNPLTFRTVFSSCAWDWRWFLVHGGIDLIKAGISFSTKHLLRDIHCSAYLCGTWYHFGNILWRLFLYSVLLGLFACIFSLFFLNSWPTSATEVVMC